MELDIPDIGKVTILQTFKADGTTESVRISDKLPPDKRMENGRKRVKKHVSGFLIYCQMRKEIQIVSQKLLS